jgi:hypothetical protein
VLTTAAHIPNNFPINNNRKNSPINLIEEYDFKFDEENNKNNHPHPTSNRKIKTF